MADFDTKVKYLETPPLSAPKTSYTIGVRVTNQGIADAQCAGYVQVFDKDTGLLVKTYQVESAVIAPGEDKQAFATEVWDLTDAEVGKQFILSGMVTSEGDTVPSNDILNPTTLTVIAGEPPDPPAVTPHKQQHENAGNDEINVTGLFGTLATPQPFADHAPTHEEGAGDELNVDGLHGELADVQPTAVHGNEKHDADFLTEVALITHNAALEPHQSAENIERPANKGQDNGYCGLNAGGLVSALDLGTKTGPDVNNAQLNGFGTWIPPVGGCASLAHQLLNAGSGEFPLGLVRTGEFWIEGALGECCFDATVFGRANTLAPGDTVTFRFYVYPTVGGALPAVHTIVWTAAPTDSNVVFHGHLRAMWDPTNNNIIGFGDVVGLCCAGGPNAESHVMPTETLSAWFNPGQALTVVASVQLTGVGILGHNFNSTARLTVAQEYFT